MKRFFLLLMCLQAPWLFASITVIKGNIKNFDGKVIKIQTVTDYFTYNKATLAETIIENGSFNLEFDLKETRQIFLKIQDKESSLFTQPGQVYNLNVIYDTEMNEGRTFDKKLSLSFTFPQAGELNQLIKNFNQAYQQFFKANYRLFAVQSGQSKIEEFVNKASKEEKYQRPEFLNNYVRYSLAGLMNMRRIPEEKLINQYLKGQPILYHNKEYMQFFKDLFQNDFESIMLTKKAVKLKKAMMIDRDLDKTIDLIQKIKNFEDRSLTELYLIHGLFKVYYKKVIEQESALNLLDELSNKASEEELIALASSVKQHLSLLSKSNAPSFSLKDTKDQVKDLADFKGKPIYLSFWADWSIPSLRELKLIKKVHEKYGDKIQFISINIDEDPSIYKRIKDQNKYDWTFLYAGEDYDLREAFQVKTVPLYYLIDENGKMKQAFAPGPIEMDRKWHNDFK